MRKIWLVLGGIGLVVLFGILFTFLLLISIVLISQDDVEITGTGNVAIIPIKGQLSIDPEFSISSSQTSSDDIIKLIERAEKDDEIQAIILEINSPGGSAVASEEIARQVRQVSKPKAAWIREAGASGAYWVATSTDHIVASRMSLVGSIGVTASYLRLGGLLNRYNITYERLVSGNYKDTGTPYRDLTEEERAMLQKELGTIHREFIRAVAENRNSSYGEIEKIANGNVFLGEEALELGLVDELGGKKEALDYISTRINKTANPVEYRKRKSFFESFGETLSTQSFSVGRGIGSALIPENAGVRI
ncbi:signal peptide peptidase SppA [Candidatus Woesearchaeota archaeon]|nr:signal peptide peptidase SppA [Candidatus Woesearchaeota archaeon]